MRQIRQFIFNPKDCVSKDAAFGLTKNDPHPIETQRAHSLA